MGFRGSKVQILSSRPLRRKNKGSYRNMVIALFLYGQPVVNIFGWPGGGLDKEFNRLQ